MDAPRTAAVRRSARFVTRRASQTRYWRGACAYAGRPAQPDSIQDYKALNRAGACQLATGPHRCDDCPNYPTPPRLPLCPIRGAHAAGRSLSTGLPWSVTTERHLCRWWVPPPHRATTTRTHLAQSKADALPTDTSAVATR